MAENKLADMSTEFAVKILNLTDGIKGYYSLAIMPKSENKTKARFIT
jgi:hypothetical protein